MNTIDRFSTASDSDDSQGVRASTDTGHTLMSDDRQTMPSSASSIVTNDSNYLGGAALTSDSHSHCSTEEEQGLEEVDYEELSDEPPSREQLAEADEVQIYDADGNARPFHSLYRGAEHQGQRQLIIFIRHFYCGVCQAYVERLCETITPSAYFTLRIPTTITIIGFGKAHLQPAYATKTKCPFRMYTDPTRTLHRLFNLPWRIRLGKKQDYYNKGVARMTKEVATQMLKAGRQDGLAGGPLFQQGGEFLFEDGKPLWCHRMRSIRGHADFETLKKVLQMQDEDGADPVTPLQDLETRRGVGGVTDVASERPKGLKLVYDAKTPDGEMPRARLARESHEFAMSP